MVLRATIPFMNPVQISISCCILYVRPKNRIMTFNSIPLFQPSRSVTDRTQLQSWFKQDETILLYNSKEFSAQSTTRGDEGRSMMKLNTFKKANYVLIKYKNALL